MTMSQFNDKIVAGVPSGTEVAHKIGDYQEKNTQAAIYNDCGIVYVPHRPYILCIMYKGDEAQARIHMSSISKMIYQYVSQAKNK
jgi:hypothetical protein